MAARANAPLHLKLLPELAEEFPGVAASYGLPPSAMLAALVWNDSLRPNRGLRAQPQPDKLKRRSLGCTLRASHRPLARRRAREQRLSLNAYLEALIAVFLSTPPAALCILQAKTK